MRQWKSLLVFLLIVFGVATASAFAKPDAWYAGLTKPWFNPPNWIFAPVWTLLYTVMAVAAWRVYVRRGFDVEICIWGLQLAPNALWSPFFFGLHNIAAALIDVVVLLIAVVTTGIVFYRRDRIAGMLLAPYAAWVTFACLLTFSIWRLNPK